MPMLVDVMGIFEQSVDLPVLRRPLGALRGLFARGISNLDEPISSHRYPECHCDAIRVGMRSKEGKRKLQLQPKVLSHAPRSKM
ncbi:hypothetical protein N7478_006568 [Penicillium angulare]|uniref:uncharacterized protein n=1 Tax=Penicillium angulare TaxID=116970 RepID=UPI002540AF4F|nr:uncharacterized protein N7478_006568 [Penicillium angulare]KAJ5281196.1 hypothetical protein N7478_006568 [Penicillium angulare]